MENIHHFGKNVKSLPLYVKLFSKKVQTSDQFIDQITDPQHPFYGAARDVAREILNKTENWRWLSERIDDFAGEVEKGVAKKVQKWKMRAILSTGKMPLCNPQSTIKWLFERMINEYKNLFDQNRINFIDIKKIDNLIKMEALNKLQTVEEVAE